MGAQKWSEAMALFQRSTQHAKKAKAEKTGLDENLRAEIESLVALVEGRQFMAHANSILDDVAAGDGGDGGEVKAGVVTDEVKKMALIDRLDTYFEDPELVKGKVSAFIQLQYGKSFVLFESSNRESRRDPNFDFFFFSRRQDAVGRVPPGLHPDPVQAPLLRPREGAVGLPLPGGQGGESQAGRRSGPGRIRGLAGRMARRMGRSAAEEVKRWPWLIWI